MKICFEKNKNTDYHIQCVDYDSPLWAEYQGAYGNVVDNIRMLMGDQDIVPQQRINRLAHDLKSDRDVILENLFENLWHQMSFYDATYLAMPYLVQLLEQRGKANDFIGQFHLIVGIGACLMTDITVNHHQSIAHQEILQSYNQSILVIQEKTKVFFERYHEQLQKQSEDDKQQFCLALLAILGDREIAYLLISVMFDECYVLCQECGYCDEEIESLSEEIPDNIVPAPSVIGQWDGSSLDDVYVWFSNVLALFNQDKAVKNFSYYYGTYTCPECGTKGVVIDLMKNYFFEL